MGKIVFECESVTPIFMYGADGKTPELRPASIKGLMRFWWRAINGDSDIERLKEAENRIFGSTKNRSLVTIRLKPSKILDENIVKIEKIPKIGYLWYPFYLDNAHKEKSCIVNLKFDVILSSYDKEALQDASYAFILLSLFGGLGSRSRRGGGSFRIKSINNKNYELISINPNKIKQSLEDKYKKIKASFDQKYSKENFTIEYSNLSTLKIRISKGKNTWKEALKDIEKKYYNFRKKKKILNNASFGLPVKYEDKKNSKKNIEVLTEPEFERRASPLIIKILKVEEKYYWLVLKLNGEFLPSETKLIKKENGVKKGKATNIDEKIVDDFLGSLR